MPLQKTDVRPSIGLALLPIVLTLGILGVQIFYFGDFTPHIPLAIGIALTAVVGLIEGLSWDEIEKGAFHVIAVSFPAVSVLILVGMIVGTIGVGITMVILFLLWMGMSMPTFYG